MEHSSTFPVITDKAAEGASFEVTPAGHTVVTYRDGTSQTFTGPVVVPDMFHNVNRRCSLPGDSEPRLWRVEQALAPMSGPGRRYLLRHIFTRAARVAEHRHMTFLY